MPDEMSRMVEQEIRPGAERLHGGTRRVGGKPLLATLGKKQAKKGQVGDHRQGQHGPAHTPGSDSNPWLSQHVDQGQPPSGRFRAASRALIVPHLGAGTASHPPRTTQPTLLWAA